MKKNWNVTLEDGNHVVELVLGFGGKRTICVDGRELNGEVQAKTNWMGEADLAFPLGRHSALATVRSGFISSKFDLGVDGSSVTTGKPVSAMPPMPAWGWLFVAACILIPIISLGGALPVLFGLGGAYGCAAVARDSSKSTGLRLGMCVGITALAWILLVVLVIGSVALRG